MSFTSKMASFIAACVISAAVAPLCVSAAGLTAISASGDDGNERCLTGTSCPGGKYSSAKSLIGIFETETGKGPFIRIDDSIDARWIATGNQAVMIRSVARYSEYSSIAGIDTGSGYTGLTQRLPDSSVLVSNPRAYASDRRPKDFSTLAAGNGWSSVNLATGDDFAFILRDISRGYKISSDPGLAGYANSGKSFLDFMVTWQVDDVIPHYFIAWENNDSRKKSDDDDDDDDDNGFRLKTAGDRDYNDFVVEIMYARPLLITDFPVSQAPEPGTAALMLLGLPAVLMLLRRRRGQSQP
jgi:hypothetical protein